MYATRRRPYYMLIYIPGCAARAFYVLNLIGVMVWRKKTKSYIGRSWLIHIHTYTGISIKWEAGTVSYPGTKKIAVSTPGQNATINTAVSTTIGRGHAQDRTLHCHRHRCTPMCMLPPQNSSVGRRETPTDFQLQISLPVAHRETSRPPHALREETPGQNKK